MPLGIQSRLYQDEQSPDLVMRKHSLQKLPAFAMKGRKAERKAN